MQHSTFTLVAKKQYITTLLGSQKISLDDLERRIFTALRESNDFTDEHSEIVERWFQPCRDELSRIDLAIYGVLEATDAKEAIAAVSSFRRAHAVRS